jgi:hypothetical protein
LILVDEILLLKTLHCAGALILTARRKETFMHSHGNSDGPAMDQAIFNLGLPMETISVYLLACGLADVGKPVTTKNLTELWNGTTDSLDQGLRELEQRNIIACVLSDGNDRAAFRVKEAHHWKRF